MPIDGSTETPPNTPPNLNSLPPRYGPIIMIYNRKKNMFYQNEEEISRIKKRKFNFIIDFLMF